MESEGRRTCKIIRLWLHIVAVLWIISDPAIAQNPYPPPGLSLNGGWQIQMQYVGNAVTATSFPSGSFTGHYISGMSTLPPNGLTPLANLITGPTTSNLGGKSVRLNFDVGDGQAVGDTTASLTTPGAKIIYKFVWQPKDGDANADPAPDKVKILFQRKVTVGVYAVAPGPTQSAAITSNASLPPWSCNKTVAAIGPNDIRMDADNQGDPLLDGDTLDVMGGIATKEFQFNVSILANASHGMGGGQAGATATATIGIDLVIVDRNPSRSAQTSTNNASATTAVSGSAGAQASDPSFTRWLPLSFSPTVTSQPFQTTSGPLPAPWGNMHCMYSISKRGQTTIPHWDIFGAGLFYIPSLDSQGTYNNPTAPYTTVKATTINDAATCITDANGDRLLFRSDNSPLDGVNSTLSSGLLNAGPPGSLRRKGPYSYTFGSNGFVSQIQDSNGNSQTITTSGVVDSSSGRQLNFVLDSNGYLSKVIAPGAGGLPGTRTEVTMDSVGRVTTLTVYLENSQAPVTTQTFSYGAANLPYAVTGVTQNGVTTGYAYLADFFSPDPFGNPIARLTGTTYGANGDYSSSWDGGPVAGTYAVSHGDLNLGFNHFGIDSRTITYTDPLGRVSKMMYGYRNNYLDNSTDDGLRTIRITDPSGSSRLVTYAPSAINPTSVVTKDELNRNWTETYAYGFLTGFSNPSGSSWTITRDDAGRPLSIMDPGSTSWLFSYTGSTLKDVTAPDGTRLIDIVANWYGQPTSFTVPAATSGSGLSEATTLTYHATTGDLTQVLDPLGNASVVNSYDALGDPLSFSVYPDTGNPATSTTPLTATLNWDASQNLIGAALANGVTIANTFDNGKFTAAKVYSPQGALLGQTNVSADTRGRLYQVSDLVGTIAQWKYDKSDNLRKVIDARGNVVQISYDSLDRPTSVTWPGGSSSSTNYDVASRVTNITDERGNTFGFVYDGWDNVIQVNGPGQSMIFARDAAGRPNSITVGSNVAGLGYDGQKRLSSVAISGNGPGYTVSYVLAGDGKRKSMTSPAGTTTYQYDQGGRLISLTDPLNQTTQWTYDHIHRPTSRTTVTRTGTTIGTTYTWGVSGQAGDTSSAPAYLRQLTQTINGNIVRQYTLKHAYLGQLLDRQGTGADGFTESSQWTYDTRGRISSEVRAIAKTGQSTNINRSYPFDAANNLFGGAGWTYNSNNQLTAAPALGGMPGATGIAWDAAGNLAAINGMSLGYDIWNQLISVTGTPLGSVTYTYDALGRRRSKTVQGTTTYFEYDGDALIAETDATGTVNRWYSWGPDGIISDYSNSNGNEFYLDDDVGDTTVIANENGGLTSAQEFAMFAEIFWATHPPSRMTSRTGYRDDETGFSYGPARGYYAPQIGSWTQPLGVATGYPLGEGDPIDSLGDCIGYGQFLGKALIKGTRELLGMPQFQPGSKERMQMSALLTCLPIIGWAKTAQEATTGYDYVGGRCVGMGERLTNVGFLALGAMSGAKGVGGAAAVDGYSVYRATRPAAANRIVYVGISNSFSIRQKFHALLGRRARVIDGLTGLTEYEAKSVEQFLIQYYGGARKWGGTQLENRINAISLSDLTYNDRLKLGHDLLERVGFFK